MTQKDYLEKIKEDFRTHILANKQDFKNYDCYNNKASGHIHDLIQAIKSNGLQFSNCYHANGIGNNNEYEIFLRTTDNDGFIVDKKIAKLHYCYGIYGGVSISLGDLSKQQSLAEYSLHYAR